MQNKNAQSKLPLTLVLLLLFIAAPADVMGGRGHGHDDDEYTMEVSALMGPEDTELTITISSSDPENFPVPEELEKLKVKIDRGGQGHGHLIDERNVELVNGQIVFSLSEAPLHARLKIDTQFRPGRHKVKLKTRVEVTLRPDLIVEDVGPMVAFVDQSFSIHANIQELLGDNDAVANVTLSADGVNMTISDVFVSAGMLSTVVFTGLSYDEPASVSFTVDISDANPGEYDLTNNSYSFDVEVIPPPTPGETEYSMSYENFDSVLTISTLEICDTIWVDEQSGDRDEFYLEGSSEEATPGGILDVSFRIYADGASAYALDIEGLTPYHTQGGIEYYDYSDEATGIYITYDRNPDNLAYFKINKYSGQDVYIRRVDGTLTEYSLLDYGLHMDAQFSLEASILFDDGFSLMGGTASMILNSAGLFEYEDSFPLNNTGCANSSLTNYFRSEYIFGENDGILDPTFLARRNQAAVTAPLLPEKIYMADNYPNPFNPRTAISFGLPEDSRVSLILYDISGREVKKLAEGRFSAGRHDLYLDGSELSSGTYFYSLEAGSFKEVKRMLLLK